MGHNHKYSTTRMLISDRSNLNPGMNPAFETCLFLPASDSRKAEGGLRTQGFFKIDQLEKPLITVITVVFNGEAYLENAIISVLNQTYDNIEYIVIDGGSTDNTVNILKQYNDLISYWVCENDQGIFDAWNKGLSLTQGKWVSFLGADDTYLPNALSDYVSLILKSSNLDYISSKIEVVSNNGMSQIIGERWCWQDFKKFMNVAHVGSLHSMNLYKKHGLYDLNFKIAGDYEMLLRPGSSLLVEYLDKVTVKMRTGGISESNPRVILETASAKLLHTKRSRSIIFFETLYSFMRWYARKAKWFLIYKLLR